MCGEMAELVEGARLEIVYGRNVIKGSNPFLSATSEQAIYRLLRLFIHKIRARSFRRSSFPQKVTLGSPARL